MDGTSTNRAVPVQYFVRSSIGAGNLPDTDPLYKSAVAAAVRDFLLPDDFMTVKVPDGYHEVELWVISRRTR